MGWGNQDRLGTAGGGLRSVALFLAMGAAAALVGLLYFMLFG